MILNIGNQKNNSLQIKCIISTRTGLHKTQIPEIWLVFDCIRSQEEFQNIYCFVLFISSCFEMRDIVISEGWVTWERIRQKVTFSRRHGGQERPTLSHNLLLGKLFMGDSRTSISVCSPGNFVSFRVIMERQFRNTSCSRFCATALDEE